MSAMAATGTLATQVGPRPAAMGPACRPACLSRPAASFRAQRRLSRAGRRVTVPFSVAMEAPPTTGDLKPKDKKAELAIDGGW